MLAKFCIGFLISAAIAGCSPAADECAEVYDRFSGHYAGEAIALENGDLTIALTQDCFLLVDGGNRFHQQVSEAWDKSQLGFEVFRAVNVDLTGLVELRERKHRYWVLKLTQHGKVTHEIELADAEAAFYNRMRRTIEGKILD